MTSLIFIENKRLPKTQSQQLARELQDYAISIALKFPTQSITDEQKVEVAKRSVKSLLRKFDLSTKNLGSLLHDEVIGNLQKLYFRLKKTTLNYHFLTRSNRELLEMIKIVRLLKSTQPRKFKRLSKVLQKQLSKRQHLIFNIYLRFKPTTRRKKLTYRAVCRLSKTSQGTVTGDVKKVVQSLSNIFVAQRIPYGRQRTK